MDDVLLADLHYFILAWLLHHWHHLYIGNTHTIASGVLRLVHGAVGVFHQFFAGHTVQPVDRYAETTGDGDGKDFLAVFRCPLAWFAGDRASQAFRRLACSIQVYIGKHEREFLSTVAAYEVLQAQGIAQPCSNFVQDSISSTVTIGVIDALEMV